MSKLTTIYRLENYNGKGPYSASQGMIYQLTPHLDPDVMLPMLNISKEEFKSVTDKGCVFGWLTKELMKAFFKDKEKASTLASKMKMKISVYHVSDFLEFPDGQVLFVRPKEKIERISVRDFLK
ncbi:hypothetical protein [Flavobacterium sp.]|jgi:hypothetical protein|uniref:hypothetical protein n=1 Tax=Flavobacterium sp. TaxID=239 RepID=UPI0037BF83CB